MPKFFILSTASETKIPRLLQGSSTIRRPVHGLKPDEFVQTVASTTENLRQLVGVTIYALKKFIDTMPSVLRMLFVIQWQLPIAKLVVTW